MSIIYLFVLLPYLEGIIPEWVHVIIVAVLAFVDFRFVWRLLHGE